MGELTAPRPARAKSEDILPYFDADIVYLERAGRGSGARQIDLLIFERALSALANESGTAPRLSSTDGKHALAAARGIEASLEGIRREASLRHLL